MSPFVQVKGGHVQHFVGTAAMNGDAYDRLGVETHA